MHKHTPKIIGAVALVVLASFTAFYIKASYSKAAAITIDPLTASDYAGGDYFGQSVAVDYPYAIVGNPYDDDNANASGSAYIFYNNGSGWAQQAKLTASDGLGGVLFGWTVSISGDVAIVGSPFDDIGGKSDQGSAYIFVKPGGGWSNMQETAKLTAGDGMADDYFGYSVSISGDCAIVGADADDVGATDSQGSAYIFVKPGGGWSNMQETAKLTANDGAMYDQLGFSVSISGDVAIVGTYNKDSGRGSAYIFVKPGGGWSNMTQTAKLTASDGAAWDYFGYSVSISGNYAIVGARYDDDNGDGSGSAYIFEKPGGGWANMQETAKVANAGESDSFGASVSISGDYAVVGAVYNGDDGGAFAYRRIGSVWTYLGRIIPGDGTGWDNFGWSVSISGTNILVGSLYHNVSGFWDAGAAYPIDISTADFGTDLTGEFTDPVFLDCVSNALGTPGSVNSSDAAALTDLDCSVNVFDGVYAENMDGIENLTSLQNLNMSGNKISDISGIKNITTLQQISFANNEITDISSLDDNPGFNLYGLDLNNYPLMGPMMSFPGSLNGFMQFHNNITDISALSGMTNLQGLGLVGNSISDITPLAGLTDLRVLGLMNNNITDISALSGLNNMQQLFLGNLDTYVDYYYNFNEISDISVINNANMPDLEVLYLPELNITDVTPLKGLDNLGYLDLSANPIGTFRPIASGNTNRTDFCSGLEIILNENDISNAANYVQAITDLTALDGASCNLTTDFSYENCANGIDDDGDGDTDSADSYCFLSTYYVDGTSGGGAGCGVAPGSPCSSLDELMARRGTEFQAVLTSPPYEDVELVVKGPIAYSSSDFVPVMTDGLVCMLSGMPCSSNSVTVRSYSDDPADMGWFTAPLVLMGKNVTVEGVGVAGNSDMAGITVMGARNANIRRNAIGWNGFGLLVGAGSGINVENNLFTENTGGIDVDRYFMGLLHLGVVVPSCGGVATAGSKDISIVNNSFYDNCDGFDIVANVFNSPDPDDLIMKVADIGIVSLDFLPVTSVENATVKQNMVYENNPGAHGYYYQPSFGSVNGVEIPDYLFDEFAVAIGGGNVNATDDPYINSACNDPACFETAFYLANPDDYKICGSDIAPETPEEDIFSNPRPDGPLEPGAFESTGGTCGGGGGSSASVCPVTPVQIDLPSSVPVSYGDDGKPTVKLSWAQGDVSDLNAEKKIEIFSDFISKNPDYTIGATEKKLESVFIRYIYDEIKKDENLTSSFSEKLRNISDKEISGVKNILASIGLQEIFSDWWPYMALYNMQTNTVTGNLFMEAVKDGIKVIENDRGDLDAITLWRKVSLTMYNTIKNEVNLYAKAKLQGFTNMQTAVNCIDDQLDAYHSSGSGGVNVSAFLEGILSGLQQSNKDKITKALDKIKDDGKLEGLLSTISFDTNFLDEMKISSNIGFSDLLNVWESNTAVRQLVDFFQTNENFRYFKQLVLGTALVSDIEACIENNYDRASLLNLVKTLRFQTLKDSIDKDGTCCDDNIKQILSDIIDSMRENPQTKDKINGFMLGFINDLLQLEDNNRKLGLTGGVDVATPFTDFYNENFGLAREEIVGGLQAKLYRSIPHLQKNDELIATVDSSVTSYTDENVPENNTNEPRDYNYYLVTETSCSQAQGRQATAKIDPVIKPGTPIDVTLDLKITVKEAFNELFMKRLMKLFNEDQTQTQVTAGQSGTSGVTQTAPQQSDNCTEARTEFGQTRTSAALFYYVIACFGQDDEQLKIELAEIRPQIIPPLMLKIGEQTVGEALNKTIGDFLAPVIDKIQERLTLGQEIKVGILPTLTLNKSDLAGIASMQDLTSAQKELIKNNIDESYFAGASHAANITIEKYDSKGALVDSYRAHTDVFGETKANIGKMLSGEAYTIKIRLTDQRFVLPKITLVTLNNAAYENGILKANVKLEFDQRFRFGNFDDAVYPGESGSKDVIDWHDLKAWGELLKQQPESWDYANLDGLSGIDLLDVVTFQQNWGEEKKGEANEISLTELAKILGIDPAAIILQGSETVENLLQGNSQMVKPDWWDLLDKACITK